jgi:urea carboxylase-associated protein 2
MTNNQILIEETLRGGQMWSRVLRRGQLLRLTDMEGKASVAALLYNADQLSERYNMPDTLKAQQTAYLTQGFVLYSDMGRILCSIVADSVGWHDTITGHSTRASVRAKYGEGSYLKLRDDRLRNTRDNFLTELAKHELSARDIVPNVNFFVKIVADSEGNLSWAKHETRPGGFVELRAELNTLIVLSNTPHPLDPSPDYDPGSVQLTIRAGQPADKDDVCLLSRPENGRGFVLTETYFV